MLLYQPNFKVNIFLICFQRNDMQIKRRWTLHMKAAATVTSLKHHAEISLKFNQSPEIALLKYWPCDYINNSHVISDSSWEVKVQQRLNPMSFGTDRKKRHQNQRFDQPKILITPKYIFKYLLFMDSKKNIKCHICIWNCVDREWNWPFADWFNDLGV